MIQAIETQYKGYYFRSRVEARWAVFFDAIGWNWHYEYEGFQLPSGPYLPDFYFPDIHTYAEVKGVDFTELEKLKCKELSELPHPKYPEYGTHVLMLCGPPALKEYEGYHEGKEACGATFVQNKKDKMYPFYMGDGVEYFPGLQKYVEKALSARFEQGRDSKYEKSNTTAKTETGSVTGINLIQGMKAMNAIRKNLGQPVFKTLTQYKEWLQK